MKQLQLFILIQFLAIAAYGQLVFGQKNKYEQSSISVNYSSPKEYEIADISVVGVEFLDNNALISLSGLKVGDKIQIPGDEVSIAIKKLWRQGIIGNVSIDAAKVEGNQIWLVIKLSERPRLSRYEFSGINKNFESELEDKIELVRGKILTDVVMKNTELAVIKFMEGKGYLNAKANIAQRQDTIVRNSAILEINVEKGKKVKIHDVVFHGNTEFSDSRLRSKFKKTGEVPRIKLPSQLIRTAAKLANPVNLYHFLTHKDTASLDMLRDNLSNYLKVNVFKPAKYVPDEYKADKALLIDFYNSKGYRDAEITFDTLFAQNDKYMQVDLHINEGNRYFFRNINWIGNFLYSDETLDGILGVKNGDTYNLELINKKLSYDPAGIDISSLYMDDGYLFFQIVPVEVGIEGDSIDIEMRVREGPQATISSVTISGNDKTSDHVIRRELRTIPGNQFNRSELIRTQRELSQLGYFNPQKVEPNLTPNPVDETVDIEWLLEEQPSDQIQLSGGWGGFFGFVGTLGVNFNNFSLRKAIGLEQFPPTGDGQRLSVSLQANGARFQSYSVSFSEPWLGGRKPNNFSLSYNQSVIRNINFRDNTVQGSLNVYGITAALGRRVQWPDDFFVVSNSLAYQRYDVFQFNRGLGFSTGFSNSITFNTTIARQSSDNPMFPTRGSDISLNINLTPPYSLFNNIDYETASAEERFQWIEYNKWNFDAKYYLALADKLIFAPRIHFGFISTYSSNVGAGPFERFVLGGDGLTGQNIVLGTDVIGLRGYPNPQNLATSATSVTPYDNDNQILGGTMFTKYVMELRYSVTQSPTASIYIQGFLEAGNNWNDFNEYNPYDLKRSAGIGARIFMPAFGLLGLDWAYGFDPILGGTNPAGTQFHFSIGQQIR
ncbi:MAG: outer membrane protein insertion porin family [Cyclobacteriaceae bacterium]|jgi:outer membrane protein insertion porin family